MTMTLKLNLLAHGGAKMLLVGEGVNIAIN
jgi:hypothetical protein